MMRSKFGCGDGVGVVVDLDLGVTELVLERVGEVVHAAGVAAGERDPDLRRLARVRVALRDL
jgi:hypothetical protein